MQYLKNTPKLQKYSPMFSISLTSEFCLKKKKKKANEHIQTGKEEI